MQALFVCERKRERLERVGRKDRELFKENKAWEKLNSQNSKK